MKKIAVTGPESTGKTELARRLGGYFGVPWVEEYARQYVEKLGREYDFSDISNIAAKQIEQELFYENQPADRFRFVFFDTELIITKVWFEYCYKTVPEFVTERLQAGFFDFYLLCSPDLPWEPDPVREHGNDREFFFDWYKQEIEKLGMPYAVIEGAGRLRLENALKALGDEK